MTRDPDGAPVLRMHHTPHVEQMADGTWQASYPGLGWSVAAATEPDAIAALQAEDQRRVESDPAYREFLFQLARKTLIDPAPGIEAEELTRSEYWLRTGGRERLTVDRDTPE